MRAPDAQDFRSMRNWIDQEQPLSKEERDHLLSGTDFVALVEKQEECWLDSTVERVLSKYSRRDVRSMYHHTCFLRCLQLCQSIFTSPEQRRVSENPNLRLRSRHRIDVLIRIMLTVTAVSMLLGPSAVLYLVSGHESFKLLLIGAFAFLFSAALHTFSKARRHENLAATSA